MSNCSLFSEITPSGYHSVPLTLLSWLLWDQPPPSQWGQIQLWVSKRQRTKPKEPASRYLKIGPNAQAANLLPLYTNLIGEPKQVPFAYAELGEIEISGVSWIIQMDMCELLRESCLFKLAWEDIMFPLSENLNSGERERILGVIQV